MKAKALYDQIGIGYDTTRSADPGIVQLLAAAVGKPPRSILDVGCGTGNYTLALAERGFAIAGLDPSSTMLAVAAGKRQGLKWINAAADDLPFPDASFDAVTAVNVVHHFRTGNEFTEIRRVLRHDGRVVLFGAMAEQIERYWLARYFPVAIGKSALEAVSVQRIAEIGETAGLQVERRISWHQPADPVDFFLYCGKHRPELYLDPAIRAGISTFTKLADEEELNKGLIKLKQDIQSGAITDIIAKSVSADGDYTLIVLKPCREFPY